MTDVVSLPDPDAVLNLRVQTTRSDDVAWVVLQGEADIATLQRLEAALAEIELDGTPSVKIDVSELDFADAATIRGLTLFARRTRRTGRRIEVCGASPTLRRIARVLEVHDDLGLG